MKVRLTCSIDSCIYNEGTVCIADEVEIDEIEVTTPSGDSDFVPACLTFATEEN